MGTCEYRNRGGCDICKTKRLKCGGERPNCNRCLRSGVQCPGYEQKLKWSTKHELLGDRSRGWQDGRGKRRSKATAATSAATPKARFPGEAYSLTPPTLDNRSPGPLGWNDSANISSLWPDDLEQPGSIHWPFNSNGQSNGDTLLDDWTMDNHLPGYDGVPWDAQSSTSLFQPFDKSPPAGPAADLSSGLERSTHYDVASPVTLPATEQLCTSTNQESTASQPTNSAGASDLVIVPPTGKASPRGAGLLVDVDESLSLGRPITDDSSLLVAYYFKSTAQIFSCYDGNLNPFRKTISNLWQRSSLIFHSVSSMAAASLDQIFPQYRILARHHRREAVKLVGEAQAIDETVLLAMLMLGGTASWHNPRDMGTYFFNTVATKLRQMRVSGHFKHDDTNFRFFQEAMMYWEMLLAYVVDSHELHKSGGSALIDEQRVAPRQVPHPWTGVARETQYLVQEVGRLVRQQRKRARLHRFMTQSHIKELQRALRYAEDLECRLLAILRPPPHQSDVVNPDDRETPLWHLFTLAEIYRSAGLIQLYRVFPDLLHARTFSNGDVVTLNHEDLVCTIPFASHADGTAPDEDLPQTLLSSLANKWACSYAVATVEKLRTIPLESGTKDFQPFLLVSLCSELRVEPDSSRPPQPPLGQGGDEGEEEGEGEEHLSDLAQQQRRYRQTQPFVTTIQTPCPKSLPAIHARGLILSRLSSYLHILPPRPIQVCIDIVRTTWAQMDDAAIRSFNLSRPTEGDGGARTGVHGANPETVEVYWMDVMLDHGWETTMA
ncbi:hypothetical protein KCU88_g7355, partial [Aureobasidium melanogenum]